MVYHVINLLNYKEWNWYTLLRSSRILACDKLFQKIYLTQQILILLSDTQEKNDVSRF